MLFSLICHPNPSVISITFTSKIYTKSDHFSWTSRLNHNPSHQHLLCLWFYYAPCNTPRVLFLKCKCKHVFSLFKICQCLSITTRIKSDLPKWSTSMTWLGTSLPLGPQLLSLSEWLTKPKPPWTFVLSLKHAKRFPPAETLNLLCFLFGTLFLPSSLRMPASSSSFKSHFRYQVLTEASLTLFIMMLYCIGLVALIWICNFHPNLSSPKMITPKSGEVKKSIIEFHLIYLLIYILVIRVLKFYFCVYLFI